MFAFPLLDGLGERGNISSLKTYRKGEILGINSGSLSLCRYRVLGGGSRPGIGRLNSFLEPHKAKPLKIGGILKEEITGWVKPLGLDPVEMAPDSHWDLSACQVEDGFLLRLRIERRKCPAPLLQLIYKQQYFEHEAKVGKAPPPKERREMREKLKQDLTGKALPAISHVDAYWRDRQGELTLFTTGQRAREIFETLFTATFGSPLELTMVRVDPPLMGLSRDAWEDSEIASRTLGRLSLTTPLAFAEQVYP